MPEGVNVEVVDGFATIDFVDRTKRGPGLHALITVGGPDIIETITRVGPRRLYRVPEGNARDAGLIDSPADPADAPADEVEHPADPADEVTGTADEAKEPGEDWSRAELNAYATKVGIEDPEKLHNKGAVLDAIRDQQKSATTEVGTRTSWEN